MKVVLARAVIATVLLWTGMLQAEEPVALRVVASYSGKEIGAEPSSWMATQDAQGVMIFAAHKLTSFDGERWRTFEGTSVIRAFELEGNDRIWTASNSDLGWFDRTTTGWEYHSLQAHIPEAHRPLGVGRAVFREAGQTTFITADKIFRWDGKTFAVWSMPGDRPLIGFRVDGKILIHHRASGIYAMGATGPESVVPFSVIGDTNVLSIVPQANNWLAVTNRGLALVSADRFEIVHGSADAFLTTQRPSFAVPLPDGRLAVASYMGGIAVIRRDGTLDKVLAEKDGLPTSQITGLFVDRSAALWATSSAMWPVSPPALRASLPNATAYHRGSITGSRFTKGRYMPGLTMRSSALIE